MKGPPRFVSAGLELIRDTIHKYKNASHPGCVALYRRRLHHRLLSHNAMLTQAGSGNGYRDTGRIDRVSISQTTKPEIYVSTIDGFYVRTYGHSR